MSFLTREQMLSASGRKFVEVEFAELGGKVRFATPSSLGLLKFRELARKSKEAASGHGLDADSIAALLSATIVDEKAKRIFDAPGAMELLEIVSQEVAGKLLEQALTMLTGDEDKDAAPGNSVASPSAS